MVTAEEGVQSAWSQVENVYQRRMDLIPNLVSTVKGYASHEAETLEGIVNARSKATQVTVDPENLTPEELQKFNEAQGELSGALGKLLAITEAYPDLKANQNFLELQAQLEGTENRIATERKKFNEVAMGYNTLIRRFPKSIIASIFGFERKGYFEAQEGADNAPKVEF
jgi:LemA protein